jgi:hypothetical protein
MKHQYVCIRCGYETPYRTAMYAHFYKKKKQCPMLKNIVELTDDIKQHILDNFIYILPINPKTTHNVPEGSVGCEIPFLHCQPELASNVVGEK